MREPIFQPGAGWTILAMALTIAIGMIFHRFIAMPVARAVGEALLRPLLAWLGLL
jgi:hypothetical protein